MKENHLQTWLKKPQHDHLFRSHQDNNQVNESATNLRLKKSPSSSHVEGYLLATKKSCLLLILKCSQLGLDISEHVQIIFGFAISLFLDVLFLIKIFNLL